MTVNNFENNIEKFRTDENFRKNILKQCSEMIDESNPDYSINLQPQNQAATTNNTPNSTPTVKNESLQPQYNFKYKFDSFTPLDCENYTPPEWIIEGYITENSLNMLYGHQKNGKSYVALDWAFSVASPKIDTWFNRSITHGHVIYFAAEGAEGIKKRLKVWLDATQIQRKEMNLTVFNNFPKIDAPEAVDEILLKIKSISEKPTFIIFDTLNRCMQGDENSTKDVTAATEAFARIQNETGAGVLVLHHEGHQNNSGKSSHPRGSSVLGGNFDCMLKIEKKGDKIILKHEYSKDEETQNDITFNFVVRDTGWRRNNGSPVMACTIELNNEETTKTAATFTPKEEKNEKPKPKLRKAVKSALRSFKRAAIEYGEIIHDKDQEFIALSNNDWRKSSNDNTIYDQDDDEEKRIKTNKRQKFLRSKKELFDEMEILEKKIIGRQENYCLPITEDGEMAEYAAEIKKAILKRKEHEDRQTPLKL